MEITSPTSEISKIQLHVGFMNNEAIIESASFHLAKPITVAQLRKAYIEYVIKICDGNVTKASRVLGVNRRTMYRRREAL